VSKPKYNKKGLTPKENAVRIPTYPSISSRQPDKIKTIFVRFLRRRSFAKYKAGIINPVYAVTRPITKPAINRGENMTEEEPDNEDWPDLEDNPEH
jgi:hypothetical protein